MFVADRMSAPAITIVPEASLSRAVELLNQNQIRHLPVVDQYARLVGIITDRDLRLAAPAPAQNISRWQAHYLYTQTRVADLMTKEVVSVGPETPLEVAASIMADRKIGGLPVLDGPTVIGVITETDFLHSVADALGKDRAGVRITLASDNYTGLLVDLSQILLAVGGQIVSMVTFQDRSGEGNQLVLKVEGVEADTIATPLALLGERLRQVQDIAPQPNGVPELSPAGRGRTTFGR